jgi:hypothetical protein
VPHLNDTCAGPANVSYLNLGMNSDFELIVEGYTIPIDFCTLSLRPNWLSPPPASECVPLLELAYGWGGGRLERKRGTVYSRD